jgi:hypothetical protein
MRAHTFFVSSILLGRAAMWTVTKFFEGYWFFGRATLSWSPWQQRHRAERRRALEQDLRLVRAREQRLAEAIAQGGEPDAAPQAVLDALRTEQARRVALEAHIAQVREPLAGSARDLQGLEPQLRQRAAHVRSLLLRELPQGREVLRGLLVERLTFMPIGVGRLRGYRFIGHGSYGGLLAGTTWPTTIGGPNGIRTRIWSRLRFRQQSRIVLSDKSPSMVTRLKHAVCRCLRHRSNVRWFNSGARNHRNRTT